MNIAQLNERILEIEKSLELVKKQAVVDRVNEITLAPLKKQLEVKVLKRQHLAKTLPVCDETDKILMSI